MPLCQGGVGDASIRHVTELPLPYPTSHRYHAPTVTKVPYGSTRNVVRGAAKKYQQQHRAQVEWKAAVHAHRANLPVTKSSGSSDACAAFLVERGSRSGTRFNRFLTQSDV